jgi:type I site-specific restriction endonuclease
MHPHEEREWKTRKTRIDRRLEAQGWTVVPFDAFRPLASYKFHAIEEFPTDNGPADYVLVSNGRILAMVEAKRLSLGPQNVLLQAERYSRSLPKNPFNFDGLHVPFLYATNGEVLWFHDIRHELNRSRQIKDFHTPPALEEMLTRDFEAACGKLMQLPNKHERLRPIRSIPTPRLRKRSPSANDRCSSRWLRHRQDVHDSQSSLQADEVRSGRQQGNAGPTIRIVPRTAATGRGTDHA